MTKSRTFIEQYANTLTQEQCKTLISLYKQDDRKVPGTISRGIVDKRIKHSMDLQCNFSDKKNWAQYSSILYQPLNDAISKYVNEYDYLMDLPPFEVQNNYNIQAYKNGEGFGKLHCELQGMGNRLLAWMIYLNDAACGTDFPYQNMITPAVEGTCVIWPAGFTHAHRGVTPNKGYKVIATGWCQYLPREEELPHVMSTYKKAFPHKFA